MNNSEHFDIYGLPYSLGLSTIILAGFVSNLLIICATLRPGTNLKYKGNHLICILAFFDLTTCISFIRMPVQIWTQKFWGYHSCCYYFSIMELFTLTTGSFLVWSVALDRYFVLKVPLRYDAWSHKLYLFLMTVPAVVFGASFTVAGWFWVLPDHQVPVCMPPTAFRGPVLRCWIFGNLVLCFMVMGTHIMGFRASIVNPSVNSDSSANNMPIDPETIQLIKRTNQSIVLVGAVYVTTWFMTVVILALINWLNMNVSDRFHVSLYVGLLATINISCNGIIYGIRSRQYRKEYKNVFIKERKTKKDVVIQIKRAVINVIPMEIDDSCIN